MACESGEAMSAELFELLKAQQTAVTTAYRTARDVGYAAGLSDGKARETQLLTALKVLRADHSKMYPHHEHLCDLCKQADAAIAKAEAT